MNIIYNIRNKFKTPKKDNHDNDDFLKALDEAHKEWKDAENYFKNVTDNDLIDYAIYEMKAARKKYIYLLKEAKRKGIKV
ncbi:hypothetical protein BET03_07185 [Thermohalobacter berrensis]|uniref:DUF2508 domain-containing protein n=1 Tax=Thermohalobacter berrensis TaxID=99594 RepID=A0A419SUE2_9FIRM|nr:hypothetical protein BET03_07185 [Thermohalobacter berrensis]